MPRLLSHLLVAAVLLCSGAVRGQTEPYTIETVLKLEEIGRSSFDPTGQRIVFERVLPNGTSNSFDNGYYNRFTRTELMVSDAPDRQARRLLDDLEGVGHVLGAWSPTGARLLIFRFSGRDWQAGIFEVATGAVFWLSLTPELPLYGPVAAWRDDNQLILITRPDGDLPWHLRMNWEPNVILSTLTQRQGQGQASVIAVGSGADRDVTSLREPGWLVSVDAKTGQIDRLAQGRFQDLEVSPDGQFAAVAGEGEVLPLDPAKPVLQGELQRARSLRIIDLDRATDWEPAPGWDLLPNLLTWSRDNELLVWMRPKRTDWSVGQLKRAAPRTREVLDVDLANAAPVMGTTSEQLPIVRAAWLGNSPILFSRTDGERADWHMFTTQGVVNLTSRIDTAPPRLAAVGDDAVTLVAEGVAWRIDGRGGARMLSSPGAVLTEVRNPGRLFGLRPQFNDTEQRDWAIMRAANGDVFRADATGLVPFAKVIDNAIEAVTSDTVLAVSETRSGVETLQRVTSMKSTDLITINPSLARTQIVEPVSFKHTGPNGEPLTSWLYAPHWGASDRLPPLVVVPYPGRSFAARPALGSPNGVGTAVNVQVLVGAGYAVLLPSLPRRAEDEAAAGLGDQIETVIDAAAEMGLFDPNRIALWGHSFGGFGALAAATQSDRFDGVIGSNGIYSFAVQWGSFTPFQRLSPSDLLSIHSNVGSVETAQGGMGKPPWADADRYVRNSPFFSADKISAPVLLISSDLDYVPVTEAEMMFSALYRQNKDAILLTYIGEGHVITGAANVRHMYGQVLIWLERIFAASDEETQPDRSDQRRAQASIIVNSITSP